jgi:hypothetical protein
MSKALPRVIVYWLLWSWAVSGRAAELPSTVQSFLKQHCFDCHDVETKSGVLEQMQLRNGANTATDGDFRVCDFPGRTSRSGS